MMLIMHRLHKFLREISIQTHVRFRLHQRFSEPLPLVTLSELEPGKYTSTQARIVYLKTLERPDALGEIVVFSGVLEDATSKVSFVSHKISFPLIRDSVYRFDSGYVHEFPDKSLLLVITERHKNQIQRMSKIFVSLRGIQRLAL